MKRRLMLTALLVLTLTLSVFPTPANSDPATRYVAPSSMGGDDTNPGTEGSPWRTIQHAVSNSNSGDIIKLMDDDNDGTKDYPEIYQVEVTKQLTIERYDDDATKPWVYQQVHYDHVFYISADHVTISGLKLAGATEPSQAGIYVGHSAYCTFNDNDVTDNYYGIYLYSSDHCNINDNNVSYNNSTEGAGDSQGIRLYKSSENTISGNTVNYNGHNGIELTGTSSEPSTNNTLNNNTVNNNGSMGIVLSGGSSSPNNTINNNTANSNDYDGIYIAYGSDNSNVINNTTSYNGRYGIGISGGDDNNICNNTSESNSNGIDINSSDNNVISSNTVNLNNNYGIYLHDWSVNNTISDNTCESNTQYGIHLGTSSNDNTIYLNNFSSNTTANVYSDGSTNNTWNSPTKLGYLYGAGSTETYKNYIGNYYSDHGGNDSNSDGICDDPYSYTTDGSNDQDPLWQTTDNYSLQTWWLSNPTMYRGDMSKVGATVTVTATSSQIWAADQAAQASVSFGAGDQGQETSWTGQVTFVSAPTSGHTFTVEIGYADDQSGTNFWADGPEATITGDDSTQVFTYTTTAVAFSVAQNKYLVMKLTNNSASDYDVRVGGSWSYCSASQGSGNYPTFVGLSSFTARSGSQSIFPLWPWLGLAGLAAMGVGGVLWAKRRIG